MIICLCRAVSERDIAREAAAGCQDFSALQQRLGVATGCGKCREAAEEAFALHRPCGGACGGCGQACDAPGPAPGPRMPIAPALPPRAATA